MDNLENQDLSSVDTTAPTPAFERLDDMSIMGFGQAHRGIRMQDVPASYLHWMWTECCKKGQTKTCPYADYIFRNLNALRQEYEDGIW